jgi:hypothetical protein
MWFALFSGSLKMVSDPPNNDRSCGTRTLHDIAVTRISGV